MPADYGILYEEVFGTSPEATLVVAPNLTVKVKDAITKKSIEGAIVKVNTEEITTDATGLAVFGELPPGEYKISVNKSGYKGWSKTVTFTPGEVISVSLWPWWIFGLGGVAAIGVGVIVVERWTRPYRG